MLLLANADTDAPPWLIPALLGGILILFPLFWSGVLVLLSHLGGWVRLARQFDATHRLPEGTGHSWVYGRVGRVSYKGALKIHLAPGGFFLETLLIFRPGHPRLFIPWSAVRSFKTKTSFFRTLIRIELNIPELPTIILPANVLEGAPVQATP